MLLSLSPFTAADSPAITSTTHQNGQWSSSNSVIVSFSYPNATDFLYLVDLNSDTLPDASTATDVAAASASNLTAANKADGVYWLHVRAKTASGLSDTTHWQIKINTSPPPRPENPTGSPLPDGTVLIKWQPSTDLAGVVGYNIYRSLSRTVNDNGALRDFTIRDLGVFKIASMVKDTNYNDVNVNVGSGRPYFYRIQPVDAAGNTGGASAIVGVWTLQLCNLKLSLSATLSDSNILIGVSSDQNFMGGRLVVTGPDNNATAVMSGLPSLSSLNTPFNLAGKSDGDYNIFISTFDSTGATCTAQTTFTYDTVPPTARLIAPPATQTLTGTVHFQVSADDPGINPSGVASVRIYANPGSSETLLGDTNLSGGYYVLDWDSTASDNGRFTITARATDRGGLKGEDSATYNIMNTGAIKAAAQSAITSAEEKRQAAASFLAGLSSRGIPPGDASVMMSYGDANLAYAKSLVAKEQFLDIAKKSANDAAALYDGLQSSISQQSYATASYSYDANRLDQLLASSGVGPSQATEAAKLIKKFSPIRALDVLKVTRDNNTSYFASVTISFTTDANSGPLSVLEIIPKSFASDASQISSTAHFGVVQSDPVIAFRNVTSDSNSGGAIKLTYFLNRSLTKEQADALLTSKVMNSFPVPPVLLQPSTDISYSQPIVLPKVSLSPKRVLVIIVVVVVLLMLFILAVAAAIAWYFFFYKKRKESK